MATKSAKKDAFSYPNILISVHAAAKSSASPWNSWPFEKETYNLSWPFEKETYNLSRPFEKETYNLSLPTKNYILP